MEPQSMSADSEARYEFRVFGHDLEDLRSRLADLGGQPDQDQSSETYVVTRLNIDAGVKVRDGQLEMKVLRAREGILELWWPAITEPLPVAGSVFVDDVAPALGVTVDLPGDAQLTEAALVEIAQSVPGLASISVRKRRALYEIDGCMAELTDVEMAGDQVQSIAVEGPDFVDVTQLVRKLGLAKQVNESYPAFFQQRLF